MKALVSGRGEREDEEGRRHLQPAAQRQQRRLERFKRLSSLARPPRRLAATHVAQLHDRPVAALAAVHGKGVTPIVAARRVEPPVGLVRVDVRHVPLQAVGVDRERRRDLGAREDARGARAHDRRRVEHRRRHPRVADAAAQQRVVLRVRLHETRRNDPCERGDERGEQTGDMI